MKKPKVTVGVILYKETKYLAHSLPSLLDQDYDEIEFILRDQSPKGEVYTYLKESHPSFFKRAKIEKGENLMHSGGHNEMIRHMKGDYYICASNDMLYPKDLVSKLLMAMEAKKAKVATPKLMQWDYETALHGNLEGSKTQIIDSLGIGLTPSHHFFDAGQSKDERDINKPLKILGPSGALGIYHKDALKAIAYENKHGKIEYFDELLHYKNDVDLAYRLSWAGYSCLLVDVKVYHDRQVGKRSKKSKWEKENSFRGHMITLEKNFDLKFSWHVRLRTLIDMQLRSLYMLLTQPSALKVYSELKKSAAEIKRKRKAIVKKVSPRDIESLMS